MNPLELDNYHEKEVAELTGHMGFDPKPVSRCSQPSVVWGTGSMCGSLSRFACSFF